MALTQIAGCDILIKTGSSPTAVAGQRNCTINIETNEIDMTVKPDAGADFSSQFKPGFYKWSTDLDGVTTVGAAGGLATLITTQLAGTIVDVLVTLGTTGEQVAGKAFYTSISSDGPHDAESTFKATLRGTGDLTPTVGGAA